MSGNIIQHNSPEYFDLIRASFNDSNVFMLDQISEIDPGDIHLEHSVFSYAMKKYGNEKSSVILSDEGSEQLSKWAALVR